MKKEEILAKSRKEKNDEGLKLIERNSSYYGLYYSTFLLWVITLIKNVKGINTRDIIGVLFVNAGISTLYIYTKNKKIRFLIISILSFAISIYYFISYYYDVLKI